MPKGLTASGIKRLSVPNGKSETSTWDSDNLALRVRKSGVKTWEVIYKLPWRRKQDRLNIGRWPEIGIEEARGKRDEVMRLVRDRQDPKIVLAAQRQKESSQPSVEDFKETFIIHQSKVKRTWKEDEKHLDKYVLPKIGKIKLKDLEREHLSSIFDPLLDTKRQGRKVFRTIHRMLEIARDRGLVQTNIASNYPVPESMTKHRSSLNKDELMDFLHALDDNETSKTTERLLKLQLCLGQRAAQIQVIEKSDYQDDDYYGPHILLSSDKTKHEESLALPLGPCSQKIIENSIADSPSTRWIIPNQTYPEKPSPEGAASQAFGYLRNKVPSLANHRPSDLRNTATQFWRDRFNYNDSVRITQLCQLPPTTETEFYGFHPYLYFDERAELIKKWEIYLTDLTYRDMDPDVEIDFSGPDMHSIY